MKKITFGFIFFVLILPPKAVSDLLDKKAQPLITNPSGKSHLSTFDSKNNVLELVGDKNQNAIDEKKESDFSVYWESSFASKKNSLLEQGWFFEIPYAEIQALWFFSKNSQLQTGFDISYKNQIWAYSVDDFFVQHDFVFVTPMSLRVGYFFYPVSWTEDQLKLFSKKNLIGKSLFSHRTRDLGLWLRGELKSPLYWQISWQSPLNKRETDSVKKWARQPVLTTSFILEKPEQKLFISYFQKNSFLGEKTRALGSGGNLSYKIRSFTLSFQGEFWAIKKSSPSRSVLTYSLFPSLKWNRLSVGAFLGMAHHQLFKDYSLIWEYILKADVQLTEHLSLRIEQFKEQGSIVREKAWACSLKTHFNI